MDGGESIPLVARERRQSARALLGQPEDDCAPVRLIADLRDVSLLLEPRQVPARGRKVDTEIRRERAERRLRCGRNAPERIELLKREIATADLIALNAVDRSCYREEDFTEFCLVSHSLLDVYGNYCMASDMSMTTRPSLPRRVVAEAIGTALLVATVIGSGVMGERLAGGNVAIALLANTIATGAGLVALILTFGSISGAHFNPAVTLADASQGGVAWRDVVPYIIAQIGGAFVGAACAHIMFSAPLFSASHHVRAGMAQVVSEFVATFGLLSVIWGCSRGRPSSTPFAVGAYISAAYWFTSSTSFANPAVTLARAASDTFAGIRPSDAPGFIVAQLFGAAASTALFRWLVPTLPAVAPRVLVPTKEEKYEDGPVRLHT